jgi:hypothetical protein
MVLEMVMETVMEMQLVDFSCMVIFSSCLLLQSWDQLLEQDLQSGTTTIVRVRLFQHNF